MTSKISPAQHLTCYSLVIRLMRHPSRFWFHFSGCFGPPVCVEIFVCIKSVSFTQGSCWLLLIQSDPLPSSQKNKTNWAILWGKWRKSYCKVEKVCLNKKYRNHGFILPDSFIAITYLEKHTWKASIGVLQLEWGDISPMVQSLKKTLSD